MAKVEAPQEKWLNFIQVQLEKQDMPMTELAFIANISYASLRATFENRHAPKVTVLEKLLKALGYNLTIEPCALPPDMEERKSQFVGRKKNSRVKRTKLHSPIDPDIQI